jgi:3-oxoacyl-[acyl-carrier protein] reductase
MRVHPQLLRRHPRHPLPSHEINPGLVETEGVQSAGFMGSDLEKGIEAQTPLGRIGQPNDILPAAVFLASSDSKYVTGQTLNVSGGIR